MNLITLLELNSSSSVGAGLSQALPQALRRGGSGGRVVDLPVDVVDSELYSPAQLLRDMQDSETQAAQKSTKVPHFIHHIVS